MNDTFSLQCGVLGCQCSRSAIIIIVTSSHAYLVVRQVFATIAPACWRAQVPVRNVHVQLYNVVRARGTMWPIITNSNNVRNLPSWRHLQQRAPPRHVQMCTLCILSRCQSAPRARAPFQAHPARVRQVLSGQHITLKLTEQCSHQ